MHGLAIFIGFLCCIHLSPAVNKCWIRNVSIRLWTVGKSMVTKAARWFSWPWTDSKQKPTKLATKAHCTYIGRFSPRLWNISHSGCHLQIFAFWKKRQKLIFPREVAIPCQRKTKKQHSCMTGKRCESVLEVRLWKFLTHQVQLPRPTPPDPNSAPGWVQPSPRARKQPTLLELRAVVSTSDPHEPQPLNRKEKIWT